MSLHILLKAAVFPWSGGGREGGSEFLHMGGGRVSKELIDRLESFYFMLEREHRELKTSHVAVGHKKLV